MFITNIILSHDEKGLDSFISSLPPREYAVSILNSCTRTICPRHHGVGTAVRAAFAGVEAVGSPCFPGDFDCVRHFIEHRNGGEKQRDRRGRRVADCPLQAHRRTQNRRTWRDEPGVDGTTGARVRHARRTGAG